MTPQRTSEAARALAERLVDDWLDNMVTNTKDELVYDDWKLIDAIAAALDAARREQLDDLRERVEELEQAFRHYHVRGNVEGGDLCAQCGLDLRDPIHIRWNKDNRETNK